MVQARPWFERMRILGSEMPVDVSIGFSSSLGCLGVVGDFVFGSIRFEALIISARYPLLTYFPLSSFSCLDSGILVDDMFRKYRVLVIGETRRKWQRTSWLDEPACPMFTRVLRMGKDIPMIKDERSSC